MDSTKFLNESEREHLETILKEYLDSETRNASMILTALYSGTRASELLALHWKDIDISNGEIRIKTLKGGNARFVVVPKFVREALKRWKDLQRPNSEDTSVFGISYPRLVEVWHEYRPVKKPFHCLRHTFAMYVYSLTKDLRFLQMSLGHKSLSSSEIYMRYEYSASEFKKLMRVR